VLSLALLAVCLGYFMVILDTTIVNVALPALGHDLDASVSGLQWVVAPAGDHHRAGVRRRGG
jgi:DHA2 family methylenomycin A resistance protein-like MFS transporter